MTARILQVVDIYDAFTTQRPYKPAYSREQAFKIMREETASNWWDARRVEAFIELAKKTQLGA